MHYEFQEIEKKWQAYWAENGTFAADNSSDKPKYYGLTMFPYPSGAGLHVGHPLGYIASDIYARYKRLLGFEVLHPMGYDAFGLPAEQYAIQTGQHPAATTAENIKTYRRQLDQLGFSFDWNREVQTCDPKYYKWTQWIFLQLFEAWFDNDAQKARPISELRTAFSEKGSWAVNAAHDEHEPFSADDWEAMSKADRNKILLNYRLAFLSEGVVNWCPELGTVLANDEVKDGVSERGGHPVIQKKMTQWSLRITAYAQRLLDGLNGLDWSEAMKDMQSNWIGRSEGASVHFKVINDLTPDPSPTQERGGINWQTVDSKFYEELIKRARENRKNPTEAEAILWERVRDRKLEDKIRRQHPIDQFIADFVCLEKKLIIEVDGQIHNTEEQAEHDAGRTYALEEIGYRLIRFTNDDVINRTDWVCNEIKKALNDSALPGRVDGGEAFIEVFTTRPDTIFGVSFMVLAPEHELVAQITTDAQRQEVETYNERTLRKSERERMSDVKSVSGAFTGAYVEHPFTKEPIPVWISDYVLASYGTGAVMAVPSGDQRDWNFAKYFNLPIPPVIEGTNIEEGANDSKEGTMINSQFLDGLKVPQAIKKAIAAIEEKGIGKGTVNYRLRDAVFGRQRYWGEPIPIYFEDGIPYPMKEEDLPLVLPEVDEFLPTKDGDPPLARAADWTYNGHPLETTTMPGWAGSSWYYLRYMDANNDSAFVGPEALKKWDNVDLYIGGAEHATGHLLYVRFWTKFLHDMGYLPFDEPAKKLINQGMIGGRSARIIRLMGSWIRNDEIEMPFGELRFDGQVLTNMYWPYIYVSADAFDKMKSDNAVPEQIHNHLLKKISEKEGIPMQNITLEVSPDPLEVTVPIDLLQGDNVDVEALKAFRHDFEDALYFTNDSGKMVTIRSDEKMSKRYLNVVNPDDIVTRYGADTMRLYEMFLGPLTEAKPWDTQGIDGTHRFLKKFWRTFHNDAGFHVSDEEPTKDELKVLHRTIKKITDDLERYSFNTVVSEYMKCMNDLSELKCNKRAILEPMVILLSPYAPHIAEELWQLLGHSTSVMYATFPAFDEAYLVEDNHTYPVSFNGKMRFQIELPASMSKEDIEKEVLANEQTQKYLEGSDPKRIIVVPKKIVNIVV